MGTLYLVATPIGNLEDISQRAIHILKNSALIAAEDTRVTRKLLARHDIHVPLLSYNEHNHLTRVEVILQTLKSGDVSVVSDAGTPGLNDPGSMIVKIAIENGFAVSPIPGACAPISALVASGLPTDAFLYLGYLPRRQKDRLTLLESVRHLPYTLIFLETPHRLLDSLNDLLLVLGDRYLACARELTKIHEEIKRGGVSALLAYFRQNEPRGEFTLVIAGAKTLANQLSEEEIFLEIRAGVENKIPAGELARKLSAVTGIARRDLYQKILMVQTQMAESD